MLGFFDMLYYSRKFKRHMDAKRAGRMTAIPQLDVPEILVDSEEQRAGEEQRTGRSRARSSAATAGGTSLLSPSSSRAQHHGSWTGHGTDLSSYDSSYGHPLAGPPTSPPTATGHRSHTSAFSFELSEPGEAAGDGADEATNIPDRGSSVDPAMVRDMLDDSIWVESLRRSATTMKKSGWGSSGGFR